LSCHQATCRRPSALLIEHRHPPEGSLCDRDVHCRSWVLLRLNRPCGCLTHTSTFHLELNVHHRPARSTNVGASSPGDVFRASSWSWAAHTGVTTDRLPSKVCHRGNRNDNPHVIRAGGVTSGGVMEVWRPGPMSVLYGAWLPQSVPNCTCLRGFHGVPRRRNIVRVVSAGDAACQFVRVRIFRIRPEYRPAGAHLAHVHVSHYASTGGRVLEDVVQQVHHRGCISLCRTAQPRAVLSASMD
jgi:hypothetical protein